MSEWLSVLIGEASDAGPVISQTSQVLDGFLEARPEADQEVLAILGKRLGSKIDQHTWDAVDDSLTHYLGRDPAYLVGWVVQGEPGDRIAEVERHAPPQVTAFLRAILGLYGAELASAFRQWKQHPDDWYLIDREISFDIIKQHYLMKVLIKKYNAEEVVIVGPPNSILELTANMVKTCRLIGAPGAFVQKAVEMFFSEVTEFHKLFSSPEEVEAARTSAPATVGPNS